MNDPFNKDWVSQTSESIDVDFVPAYADITVILDGSGSMASMKESVIKGYNDYIKSMRETPGDSKWTMVQFDDYASAKGAGEAFPKTVYEFKGEKEVPFLSSGDFLPRGGTALIDATCEVIKRTEMRTSGKEDHVKVIMMIVTDGQENASVEYNNGHMREMIARTQGKGWQYIYLGANQDVFAETQKHGVSQSWLNSMAGGALVAPPMGLAHDSSPVNPYDSTSRGMVQALGSGFIGVGSVVSGSLSNSRMVQPNAVVSSGAAGPY